MAPRIHVPLAIKFLRAILRRWLDRVPVPVEAIDRILEARKQGKTVFFMREGNWVDYLIWQAIAGRAGVPEPTAIVGLQRSEGPIVPDAALVFIEGKFGDGGQAISNLLGEAKTKPVFLFPLTMLWNLAPRSVEKSLLEIIFRPRRQAPWYRRSMWLVLGAKTSRFLVAPPIELHQLVQQAGESDAVIARKVRMSIRYHLAREERGFLGPRLVPRARLIERALNDKAMKEAVAGIAAERGVPATAVRLEAEKVLDEIAADFRWSAIRFLEYTLSHIWARIYEDFHIDMAGLERIREAAKHGPVILIPCHKSHMDYLIISYLFKRNDFVPPHIAAGANLSFFPMGQIFRRCGAFFIRRSFIGDRVYENALKSYIKVLLRENYNIEFFIEGTRSRSGKIMPPKFGMMSMVLEAQNELPNAECRVVPISIDYESLVEESSMVKEAQGAEKKEESVGGLIEARRTLKRKYGNVYVRFGEPTLLRDIQAPYRDAAPLEQAKHVSYDILEKIQQSVTVTATALVAAGVCVHHKRGIRKATLIERIALLREAVERKGARVATEDMMDFERSALMFVRNRVLRRITIQNDEVFAVDDAKRMALDYYKNNIVHFLVNTSFACLAFRISRDDTFEHLWQAYSGLHEIFVEEFHRVYSLPKPEELQAELDWLASKGLIRCEGTSWRVIQQGEVMAFENVTRNFLESAYIAVMSILENQPAVPKEMKDWLKLNAEMGELLYAKGDIWRPESRSKINLSNALNSFRHKNLLLPAKAQPAAGRKAAKSRFYADAESIAALERTRDLLQKILVEVQLN